MLAPANGKRIRVLLALLIGVSAASRGQHAAAVTVDGASEPQGEFQDLGDVGAVLNGVRLVLLGEPTHGDGAVFRLKARLIRYLHEHHGFDVLALEAGELPMDDVDRALASADVSLAAAVDRGLLSFWRECSEVLVTFDYVRRTKSTEQPITVAGFDNQLTATDRSSWLQSVLEPLADSATELGALRSRVTTGFNDFFLKGTRDLDKTRSFISALDSLSAEYDEQEARIRDRLGRDRAALVRRSIDDTRLQADMMASFTEAERGFRVEDNNPRDRRMADNLLWLLEDRFPERKMIAWLASAHALFAPSGLEDSTRQRPFVGMLPTGEILRSRLGSGVLSIGFTAIGGEYGSIYDQHATSLEPPISGSLEADVASADGELRFINFRSLPPESPLRDFRAARPMGYEFLWARWDRHLDGLYVLQRMTPATPR